MTRAKKDTPSRIALVRVRTSFDLLRRGQEHEVAVDDYVEGLLTAGLVEIVEWREPEHGETETGPGGAEPAVDGEPTPEG